MSIPKKKSEKASENNLFFEGRIRDIEQEIINFQLNIANSTSQSDSLQKIISYLLFHEKLTQSQIKKLASLSKSTISTGLLNLMNIGYVKKEKIQGSREYQYFISANYKESFYNVLGNLEKDIQFLEIILLELKNNHSPNEKGFTLLLKRIEEIIRVFGIYQKIIDKLEDDSIEIDNKDPALDLTINDIRNIDIEFSYEIKHLEDEIIDHFLYNSAYATMDELTMQIYTYFLTRKVLTQKRLRNLTGLSLGKISQIINFLLELQVIERLDKKKLREIIPTDKMRQQFYSMNSIQKSFFKSGLTSGKILIQNKRKFEELKNELITKESEIKKLNGYKKVYEVLDNYIELFSNFHRLEQIYMKFI